MKLVYHETSLTTWRSTLPCPLVPRELSPVVVVGSNVLLRRTVLFEANDHRRVYARNHSKLH
jgi:hypothetical protein